MDAEALKQAAGGRWADVLQSIGGVDPAILDSRPHPCPKCGGKDRFRAFDDFEQTGGVFCNQCFSERNGDGFSALQWLNGWTFPQTINRVAEFLNMTSGTAKAKTNGHANGHAKPKRLAIEQMTDVRPVQDCDREDLRGLIEAKRGITFQGIRDAGAKFCRWGGFPSVAFPAFNQRDSEPCGFLLMRADGKDFPEIGTLQARNKHNLKGGSDGFVIIGDLDSASTVWKVEGVPDALALAAVLPEGQAVVSNICGAKSKSQPVELLAGKTVLVVPHADKPGTDGAAAFAQRAAEHAQSVRLVPLPYEVTPDHGKDVRDFLNEGGTFAQLNHIANEADPVEPLAIVDDSGSRISIEITPDEYLVNEQATKALARDERTFQRGGMLVHVTREKSPSDGIARPKGSARIVPLPDEILRERLTQHAVFFRRRKNKDGEEILKHDHPPGWCSKAIGSRGHWPEIRPLEGIVTHPILKPDGTVLDSPGYDDSLGLIYEPVGEIPRVDRNPTRQDARDALAVLVDLVCDFPFRSPAHRSTWLAYLLTPFARFAFQGPVPLFLIDANVRGSGKSLLADLVAMILTGDRAPRMSNPKNDEECRKLITSLVIFCDLLILIDNIEGHLGCASLDAALTGTVWKDRILGRSEIVEMPLRMVWAASGNNVILAADTSRRTAHIRLQSEMERPEERSGFKYPNILQHVSKNRPRIMAAALTVLRAYCHAGRPDMGLKPWGSFEGWSDLIRNALVWCGQPDPAETREELTSEADGEAMTLKALLGSWHEIDPTNSGIKTSEILKKLEDEESRDCENFRDAITELCPTKGSNLPSPRSLGNKLRHFKGRIVDGKSLDSDTKQNFSFWFVREIDQKSDSQESRKPGNGESVSQCESNSVANAYEKNGSQKNKYINGANQTHFDSQTHEALEPTVTHHGDGTSTWEG